VLWANEQPQLVQSGLWIKRITVDQANINECMKRFGTVVALLTLLCVDQQKIETICSSMSKFNQLPIYKGNLPLFV
jgi:hypothetical protein